MERSLSQKLRQISPDKIRPNPSNPRMIFRQDEMENLLVSIAKHGIQVPIVVYEDKDGYTLIDGERRWRCATKLNLKVVPALVQKKPTPLQNILLMYNIHALREQWDYFTIATNLQTVITLFREEYKREPNEIDLSEGTGLTRGQIRRCKLLLDLPEKYKDLLLQELELPKSRQKISEDFFLEMEKSLKTVVRRLPGFNEDLDNIRDTLVQKFRQGSIGAVTDFRQLSKIATAADNLGLKERAIIKALKRIFDSNNKVGIREIYQQTVEFEYHEKRAAQQIALLNEYLESILEEGSHESLEEEFLQQLRELLGLIQRVFRS